MRTATSSGILTAVSNVIGAQVQELPEAQLEPLRETTLTTGELSSEPSATRIQIPISTQDQKSVTSNTVVTVPQSSVSPLTHNAWVQPSSTTLQQASTGSSSVDAVVNSAVVEPGNTILQQASTSSSSVVSDTQLPKTLMAQSSSRINHSSRSSVNNDKTLLTSFPHPTSKTGPHAATSISYQTSSSSSSSSNCDPSPTNPSDSMPTGQLPTHAFPATTLVVVVVPLATQTIVPEATASSAVGLVHTILAGMGIVPPGASASPGKTVYSAIQSGSNGSGSVTGSGSITGTGITTGSGFTTGNGTATGTGSTTGSGTATGTGSPTVSRNPTASVTGHTAVPTVSTGEAKAVHEWANRWLEFALLIWGVGMVYWM